MKNALFWHPGSVFFWGRCGWFLRGFKSQEELRLKDFGDDQIPNNYPELHGSSFTFSFPENLLLTKSAQELPPPSKENMAMDNPPFEDVFPIKKIGILQPVMLVFQGVIK